MWLFRTLTAVLLLVAGIVAPGLLSAQEEQQSNVTPQVGPPGTRFAFVAYGFDDDDRISTWLNAPDGTVMEADVEELRGANDEGRADWYWTAPQDAQRGVWQMVAYGDETETERVIPFEIRGDPAPVTSGSNVTPQVGPPGARFAFVAFGFEEDEQIGIWLNAPDGSIVEAEGEELNTATSEGRADWYWTAPEDALTGTWQMVAEGKESGNQVVIPFEIRNP